MGSREFGELFDRHRDQLISSFLEIAVGQTVETARNFLQEADWNINEAIHIFLLHKTSFESSSDDIWFDAGTSRPSYAPASEESGSTLSSLFRPPSGMLFEGSFQEAKSVSSKKNEWLLVNLQSKTEFASHALNRDLWSDEAVKRMVVSNFLLLQVYDHTTEGQKVSSFYKIDYGLPVVLLIDPVTGQKMRAWSGVIEAESFVKELRKFRSAGPNEHIASSSRNMGLGTEETCLLNSNIYKVPPPSWGEEFEELDTYWEEVEEEEGEDEEEEEEEEETCYQSNNTDHVEAPSWGEEFEVKEKETCLEFPDLTEEPKGECDRSLVCNLCVRFPDGKRKQRKFLKSEPIQLLWSFCYSHMEESDERKVFKLVHAIPGASKALDYEADATFDQSGLDNSMISVTWE